MIRIRSAIDSHWTVFDTPCTRRRRSYSFILLLRKCSILTMNYEISHFHIELRLSATFAASYPTKLGHTDGSTCSYGPQWMIVINELQQNSLDPSLVANGSIEFFRRIHVSLRDIYASSECLSLSLVLKPRSLDTVDSTHPTKILDGIFKCLADHIYSSIAFSFFVSVAILWHSVTSHFRQKSIIPNSACIVFTIGENVWPSEMLQRIGNETEKRASECERNTKW